jgi:hypothetical protein
MYSGRHLDHLSTLPLKSWSMEELSFHHYIMSQLSPLLNQQGVSLHHQVINEIERRRETSP